jgi:hypothetical protein
MLNQLDCGSLEVGGSVFIDGKQLLVRRRKQHGKLVSFLLSELTTTSRATKTLLTELTT